MFWQKMFFGASAVALLFVATTAGAMVKYQAAVDALATEQAEHAACLTHRDVLHSVARGVVKKDAVAEAEIESITVWAPGGGHEATRVALDDIDVVWSAEGAYLGSSYGSSETTGMR